MNKEKFGDAYALSNSAVSKEKQDVLEQGDAYHDTHADAQGYQRHDILQSVQLLLMGAYEFNINPLPQLRKFFPRLSWKFHTFSEVEDDAVKFSRAIRDMVSASDFFWKVHPGSDSEWVSASRTDTSAPRLKMFGSGSIDGVYRDDEDVYAMFKALRPPPFATNRSMYHLLKDQCSASEDVYFVTWQCDFTRTVHKIRK